MKLLYNKDKILQLTSLKTIFVDNDILGELYRSASLCEEIFRLLPTPLRTVDLIEFEFLRDIFDSKTLKLKREFINSPFFEKLESEIFYKIFPMLLDNSLLITQVYKHQKYEGNSSPTDLLLASLMMILTNEAILLTSNKKDFPNCVFDTLEVINMEKDNGQLRSLCLLSFNKENYNSCMEKLKSENTFKEEKT